MILTITLNPALDVTYLVGRLKLGASTRVAEVVRRAGGKGVNVARVAAACGADTCATGLSGGQNGLLLRGLLGACGVTDEFEPIGGDTRQTITITSPGRHPTELRERGPVVTAEEWARFRRRFTRLAPRAGVVVMSGSLPPGVPLDAYGQLTADARAAGEAIVIVDAGGPALRHACAQRPGIVKPNERELLDAAGTGAEGGADGGGGGSADGRGGAAAAEAEAEAAEKLRTLGAAAGVAEELRALGAVAVVASLSRGGSLAVTPAGRWRVTHERLDGNPVGAGDALVAGLALAAEASRAPVASWTATGWAAVLTGASGLAMASVLAPAAGEADPVRAQALAANVRIRKLREGRP